MAVPPAASSNLLPRIEVGARYGVSDRVDLGLRIGDSGATATTRVQLVRTDGEVGFELLIAPGLQYVYSEDLFVELPVVMGLRLRGGHELLLAPRVAWQSSFVPSGLDHPAQYVFVGGSLGFAWQVTRRVALVPELGVLVNVYSEPGFASFTAPGPRAAGAVPRSRSSSIHDRRRRAPPPTIVLKNRTHRSRKSNQG